MLDSVWSLLCSQVQVIPGQTFEAEWSNGHAENNIAPVYFAVVPITAFNMLALDNVRRHRTLHTHVIDRERCAPMPPSTFDGRCTCIYMRGAEECTLSCDTR
jgi:hypothetical protein